MLIILIITSKRGQQTTTECITTSIHKSMSAEWVKERLRLSKPEKLREFGVNLMQRWQVYLHSREVWLVCLSLIKIKIYKQALSFSTVEKMRRIKEKLSRTNFNQKTWFISICVTYLRYHSSHSYSHPWSLWLQKFSRIGNNLYRKATVQKWEIVLKKDLKIIILDSLLFDRQESMHLLSFRKGKKLNQKCFRF